jgi:hypothetical protein
LVASENQALTSVKVGDSDVLHRYLYEGTTVAAYV